MSRAKDLYSDIRERGLEAIDDLLAESNPEPEGLFLEYKQTEGKNTGKVSEEDRKNLAKDISAFGNTEGGIVIWGIKCKRQSGGIDVPTHKKPIKNVAQFRSRVEGLISGLTLPAHSGVENHTLMTEIEGEGYLITYIPRSDYVPIRSLRDDYYYMRVGSSCVRMPHGVLASMFGKRPEPKLNFSFVRPRANIDFVGGIVKLHFRHYMEFHNPGVSLNRDMYVTYRVTHKVSQASSVKFELNDSNNWTHASRGAGYGSFVSKPAFLLAPFASVDPIMLSLSIQPFLEAGLEMDIFYGCEGTGVQQLRLSHDLEEVETLIKQYFDPLFIARLRSDSGLAAVRGDQRVQVALSRVNQKLFAFETVSGS